jgi:hypothetical protein
MSRILGLFIARCFYCWHWIMPWSHVGWRVRDDGSHLNFHAECYREATRGND